LSQRLKDLFESLELEKGAVDKIMKAVSSEYVLAEDVDKLQKMINDLQERVNTFSKQEDAFKAEMERLSKEKEEVSSAHMQELLELRKGISLEKELTLAGARNHRAVKAFLDEFLAGAKLDESHNVVGLAEAIEKIRSDPETAFLFASQADATESKPSRLVGAKAGESGGSPAARVNPFARETFDLEAQGKLFRANPDEARAMALAAGVVLG